MNQHCVFFFFHRPTSEASWSSAPTINTAKSTSNVMEDPFKVLESTSRHVGSSPEQYSDPLEEIGKLSSSRSTKNGGSLPANGGVYDDMDPFDGLGKSVPAFSSERNSRGKSKSPLRTDVNTSWNRSSASKESIEKTSIRSTEIHSQKKLPVEIDQESHQNPFDMPTFSTDSHKSFGQTASPPSYMNASSQEANVQVDMSPRSEEKSDSSDDVWLTVSEIPLFTQPTSAPPPSRPPPPRPVQVSNSKGGLVSPAYTNSRKKVNEYTSFPNSAQHFQGPQSAPAAARDSVASPFDELEDFAMGRSQNNVDESSNGLSSEELGMNSAAAAMKEAMDRAEAKFRHAKEVRERESTKAARSRDAVQPEKDERPILDERALREKQERLDRERLQREREDEKEQKRLEKERERARELEREREEKEKEQRRIEKERERAREIEREREKARHAVERATREARERAAADARTRAEKAAVEKANAEARDRAGRAAVQRAQAEARERAAADAKERAEKAAIEARDRSNAVARAEADARARAERAAVERVAAEARERAAAEARERAASARMNQQKNESDLESFFSAGRASSAPRPRANPSVRT